MKTPHSVAVVVPVYNRAEVTCGFVEQFLRQTYRAFELVIVDHGTVPFDYSSFDDDRLTVLRASSDLWWTGAINEGLRYVLEDAGITEGYILVANDDMRVKEDYLATLLQVATSHPQTIVGSVCVSTRTNRVLYAGLSLSKIRARFRRRYVGYLPEQIPEGLIATDILPGRGVLIPTGVFERVGLFDERHLPHYGADNEFSWRARKQGYALVIGSRCVVQTEPRKPPDMRSLVTFREYATNQKRSGNLPTVAAFASLCFSRPYGIYYTSIHAVRCLLSYAKRSAMRLWRNQNL